MREGDTLVVQDADLFGQARVVDVHAGPFPAAGAAIQAGTQVTLAAPGDAGFDPQTHRLNEAALPERPR